MCNLRGFSSFLYVWGRCDCVVLKAVDLYQSHDSGFDVDGRHIDSSRLVAEAVAPDNSAPSGGDDEEVSYL